MIDEQTAILLSCNNDSVDPLQNLVSLSPHYLYGLRLDFFVIFGNNLVILSPFSCFNGTTHTYLLKI